MAKWDNGYVSDVVYTRHAYHEMTPAWLATMSLLLGQRPPDLSRPFRYADLGCGHGLTATIVAATCPHAEVWAFDFNPAHIESGRHLAAAAGLTNLRFQEASFADLAALPSSDLPEFDFIVSHGVASWISPEDRASLIQIIGQRLRAGGLAYLSYNLVTGWASMLPVRSLMRTLMASTQARSDRASAGILDYLDQLKEAGAQYFVANPAVAKRLTEARPQEARYLAHEYLNADWHPLMFADVAEAMSEVKCTFIGSASPAENLDALSVPSSMLSLMAATPDRILRETLRDFAVAQAFRRDIYRRGTFSLNGPEQLRLFDEIEAIWTGRDPGDPIQLTSPLGHLNGLPEVYGPLMQMVMAGGHTLGAIRRSAAFVNRPATDLSQAISLLMASGYVQPALPESVRTKARAGTDRLNAAICAESADGGDIALLAGTSTGTSVGANPVEMLVLRELLRPHPAPTEAMIDSMLAALRQSGRSVHQEGKIVEDMAKARIILQQSLAETLRQRVPVFARLGVMGT